MPEARLQSNMLNDMSRAQRAAMFQRGQIAANQREWLDYIQARDGGAFQPFYGGGYLHEEYLPGQRGQTNPYLKYYAAQQARQAEFQRQRFLNAQRFQNSYMLQQQKAMDIQFAEEQEVARNKQEMERQLAFVHKELDALQNNPEIDKNSWEYKARRQQLLDDEYKLQTGLDRNTPQVHEEDSGFKDSQGNPIISRFILDKNDEPIYHVQGKEVAANQLERDKFEQAKIDAARKANHEKEVLAVAQQNAKTARLKEENSAAAQSNSSMDKKLEVADKLEARKKEAAEKRRDKIDERFRSQQDRLDTKDEDYDQEYADLEQQRFDALEEFDQKEAEKEWRGDPNDVPADMTPTYRPTRGEVGDEIRRRNLLNKDDPTEDELNEQVQYDSPMDPEFSDEQFAGTEPAGLYDPTGQPLPMDGGMYNGFA